MLTLDQIKKAHSKVRTGADFPMFFQDLIELGVKDYDTFVSDGHTVYHTIEDEELVSPASYHELEVSDRCDEEEFLNKLRSHQQGHTDYAAFCIDCAHAGIEKWTLNMKAKTCTYFDKAGKVVFIENIPVRN